MTYQVIPWLVFVFLPGEAILAELDSVLCNPVWLVTTIGFKSTLSPNWANNALCFECNLLKKNTKKMFNVNENISARQQVKVDTYNSNKIRKK